MLSRKTRAFLFSLPLFPCWGTELGAQEPNGGRRDLLWRLDGTQAFERVGAALGGAGDANGDGYADFLVGVPSANGPAGVDAGRAALYSGATGALLQLFHGEAAGDGLGAWVQGAGDADGDGYADVILGAPYADPGGRSGAGSAYVYSGLNGLLLFKLEGAAAGDSFGFCVAGAGDVDGDGLDDLAVGAPRGDAGGLMDCGSAYLFSAAGGLLRRYDGLSAGDNLGVCLDGAGDVNGDLVPDLLVSGPNASPGGMVAAGSAWVYSGADGAQLYRFDGLAAGANLGIAVAGAGDVNGDGVPDLMAGMDAYDGGAVHHTGSAFVFSGAGGGVLYFFIGEFREDHLGLAVDGAGDVNGDGHADLIAGSRKHDPNGIDMGGAAYVYSGRDGIVLMKINGLSVNGNLGEAVAGAGDVNGSGRSAVLAGAPNTDLGGVANAGSAMLYAFDPQLTASGTTLSVSNGGLVQLDLDFPAAAAGYDYRTVLSASGAGPTSVNGLPVPLTADDLAVQTYLGNYPGGVQGGAGTLDGSGDATVLLNPAPGQIPGRAVGLTVYAAAIAGPAGGTSWEYATVAAGAEILP